MSHPVLSKSRVALACLAWLLALAALPAAAHDYQSFRSDGTRIAYTDYGSGVPVIFLHGLNGSYAAMARNGDLLSKEFRIIGIDQRGFGRSDKPHDGDAYGKHMANDVLNLMDHLHIRKAHLVGHSMGGVVTLYLAAHHPERFHSGVTVGNGLLSRTQLDLIGWLIKGMSAWTRAKAFFGAATEAPAGSDPVAPVLTARSLTDLAVTDEQAATMKLPLLAIRGGEKDDPRNTVERLVQVNPSVQMIRIEPEDHVSILASEGFMQGLKAFLLLHNAVPGAAPGE